MGRADAKPRTASVSPAAGRSAATQMPPSPQPCHAEGDASNGSPTVPGATSAPYVPWPGTWRAPGARAPLSPWPPVCWETQGLPQRAAPENTHKSHLWAWTASHSREVGVLAWPGTLPSFTGSHFAGLSQRNHLRHLLPRFNIVSLFPTFPWNIISKLQKSCSNKNNTKNTHNPFTRIHLLLTSVPSALSLTSPLLYAHTCVNTRIF